MSMKRKYTVNADIGKVGITRDYEFHTAQRVRVESRSNLGYGDITKLGIVASCPTFELPGTLRVSFCLNESGDDKEDKPDVFRVGKNYTDVSELRSDFNKLEAGIVDCYLNVKEIIFRQPSADPHNLEFISEVGE